MRENQAVLYAEDDDNDAFLMKRAFRLAAIPNPLRIAGDGQEAMEYFAGTGQYSNEVEHPRPCLVLLDLKMPLKSGLDVLKWIRTDAAAMIPVLMLSSSNQSSDIEQAYVAGANAFLIKPGNPAELLTMVRGIKRFWLEV
jgi:CheY-like chemotaxis protein